MWVLFILSNVWWFIVRFVNDDFSTYKERWDKNMETGLFN